jgi:hypothetical protein
MGQEHNLRKSEYLLRILTRYKAYSMCILQVEGEAQGSDDIMQKFFQQINKGPRMAHVVKLEKRDLEPRDGEDHFSVMRTAESMFGSES